MEHAHAADGTRIAFARTGTPTGEPLLLLPGQTLDHTMWDELVATFAAYDVVALDPRGTGASEQGPDLDYTIELLAQDALAVLDHLRVRRAHIIGFSMGGRVAQVLAAQHPERVGALVLAATTPGGEHQVERSADATRALKHLRGEEGMRRMAEHFFTPDWCDRHPEVVETVLPHIPPAVSRAHFAASMAHDAWTLLPSIAAPTLVVHGTDDELTPVGNATLLDSCIRDATLVVVPDARHGVLHEMADEVLPVVLEFLRRHRLDVLDG